MQLARVCGQVISTKKAEKLVGFKILVCQPIDMVTFEEKGAPFVSIDSVGAGDGELVMCVSGSSSRQTAVTDARPVDSCIVAIIDSVDINGERCFDKADPDIKPAAAKKEKEQKLKETPKEAPKAQQAKKAEQRKTLKPVAKEDAEAQRREEAKKIVKDIDARLKADMQKKQAKQAKKPTDK